MFLYNVEIATKGYRQKLKHLKFCHLLVRAISDIYRPINEMKGCQFRLWCAVDGRKGKRILLVCWNRNKSCRWNVWTDLCMIFILVMKMLRDMQGSTVISRLVLLRGRSYYDYSKTYEKRELLQKIYLHSNIFGTVWHRMIIISDCVDIMDIIVPFVVLCILLRDTNHFKMRDMWFCEELGSVVGRRQ